MKTTLNRRYRFSASHRLHSEEFSEAENWKIYGKCNSLYGHGHNYVMEVGVSGPVDRETGMVVNLSGPGSICAEGNFGVVRFGVLE